MCRWGGGRGAEHEAAATAHRLPWLSTGSVPSLLTGGREREEREWRGAAVPEWGGPAGAGWVVLLVSSCGRSLGGRGFREGPGQ